jgi:hypothetical protein
VATFEGVQKSIDALSRLPGWIFFLRHHTRFFMKNQR